MPKRKIKILLIASDSELHGRLLIETEGRYSFTLEAQIECSLRAANNSMPDIIIIQSSLPKENPQFSCQTLKSNRLTSHIPIILILDQLPLKEKSRLLNVDVILTSSFSRRELLRAIQNVIRLRIRLMQRFPMFYKPNNVFVQEQIYLSELL